MNDVAIINLRKPLPLKSKGLAKLSLAKKAPTKGTKCLVAGWGAMNRDGSSYPWVLREVGVNIRDFKECRRNHHHFLYYNQTISKKDLNFYVKPGQNFCAGDGFRDSCMVSLLQNSTVGNFIFEPNLTEDFELKN